MAAVKRNGLVLAAVPGELRTPQICRAALKAVDSADYKILPYIPYPDICLEGLKKFGMSFVDKFEIFASIAPEVMTGELALHGVGMDASCLSLVPVELRTEAVCLRAVSGDGILLHEVPEELRTERVCEDRPSVRDGAGARSPGHPLFSTPNSSRRRSATGRWPVPTTCVSSAISLSRIYT